MPVLLFPVWIREKGSLRRNATWNENQFTLQTLRVLKFACGDALFWFCHAKGALHVTASWVGAGTPMQTRLIDG